jgi:type IV pilus assembly protein PilQ
MKLRFITILFILLSFCAFAQEDRIQSIKNNLELLAVDNPAYNETLKLEVNVSNVTLPNFLMAVSKVHQLNLSVGNGIANIKVVNNFANVTVADLLVFLCKEYHLTIDFTGSILSIKQYQEAPPIPEEKIIGVDYNPKSGFISMDVSNDPLDKVFRKVMEASGKNLLYSNNLKTKSLNIFLNDVPFDTAMEKLADINDLTYSKSRDGFYLFSSPDNQGAASRRQNGFGPGMRYEVLDTINKILNVDFNNSSIANIIGNLSHDLHLDVYTATPLEEAGNVTFKAKSIFFDDLLTHIFESQSSGAVAPQQNPAQQNNGRSRPNQNSTPSQFDSFKDFTFKKENNIYFFGTADQLSLRQVEIIQMMHRSVELLSDPSGSGRTAGRTNQGNVNFFSNGPNANGQGGNSGFSSNRRSLNNQSGGFNQYDTGAEALVSILPDEIKANLDIKVDFELNSFFVSGPASKIQRFKNFIKEIDKPVPVVLIEVMIIEVRKSANLETGISWGLGDESVSTSGNLFPEADVTLGAQTVNNIIGGFDGFGSFNIGQVVPGFFAKIKALEANGNIKIRSTPKLSTLNGHRANLSIGETTYYVVTNQNFFGSQVPTTSEVRNYAPIDAELGVSIKPLVSGDGQVTLDINVIQSDFSGERIEEDAPPGLTSREFSSIIRMQNQDLAILGGLEEKIKNDSGSGVPLLSRVPVLKWLVSKRKREDTKQKLTILVKPTVIY